MTVQIQKNNSVIDKIKCLATSVLWQLPWLGGLFVIIWYVKKNLMTYLMISFELNTHVLNANILGERTKLIKKSLSLTNPMGYADYAGAVSADLFAQAKVATLQQTVQFLNNFCVGLLDIVWVITCIYAVIRVLRLYRTKKQENDIANAVVAKIIPILADMRADKK